MATDKRLAGALKPAMLMAASAAIMLGGCGMQGERPHSDSNIKLKQQSQQEMQQLSQQLRAGSIVVGKTREAGVSMTSDADGQVWVPLELAARVMNMKLKEMRDGYAIGDTDVAYRLRIGERNAKSGSRNVQLPDAPRSVSGKPSVTTESLTTLLETPVRWNASTRELNVTPMKDTADSSTQRGISMQMTDSTRAESIDEDENEDEDYNMQASNSATKVVSAARKLLGAPYDFGAASYSETKSFDCSSFTQHVFDKVSVSLPRTAREQGQLGKKVSQSNLKPGDMLFFYTPGRFESNRVVGHVSIYIGNGKMIHTYGEPGVVEGQFNSYWKGRFLFAKRVL
ncbi:C40 family peptidase [Paenibacillus herberti]|uniref:Cell wall hydrolase n=1 Tax=Paenibacillus herberti TaxID=1619309 RepID=A0A229NU72_9BACL|nr:C40 family peptidase [Paenibacillus herberti]OXM13398.1 cell wall hydrolase [Paenibacillus herberti]